MSTYLTTGVILNVSPWRERDRVYNILTERVGKVELLAAGSSKLGSKLSPHLLPFSEVELMVAQGKKIHRLAGAKLRRVYLKPPYHLPSLVLGTGMLEIVNRVSREAQPEPEIFNLLKLYLSKLSGLPREDQAWRDSARNILAKFINGVINSTGLALPLSACAICKLDLKAPLSFSWGREGFCHSICLSAGEANLSIDYATITGLRELNSDFVVQSPVKALAFLVEYVKAHTGRELYTLHVLRSIL